MAYRLVVIVFCFFAIFVALCVQYWGGEFREWPTCVFGKADCSLTFATYLLVLIAALALCAAAAAAVWAWKTYEMEQSMILSQRECTPNDHNDAMLEYYIADQKVISGPPPVLDRWSYISLDSELESVGRSPVFATGLHIEYTLTTPFGISESDASQFREPMTDVRLRSEGSAHMRIYLRYPLVNAGAEVRLIPPASPKDAAGREIIYRMMKEPMRSKYRVLLPLELEKAKDEDDEPAGDAS